MSVTNYPIASLLVQWFAAPLSAPAAEAIARHARQRLERLGQQGCASFSGIMQQTIADWWLDAGNTICPTRGIHYASSKRKLALYHLIVGQLLISCKLQPAMDYLDMGLRHADGLIKPGEYFTLYNRHEELRYLTLTTSRQQGYDLPALLNESRVIRRLTHDKQYSRPTNTTYKS